WVTLPLPDRYGSARLLHRQDARGRIRDDKLWLELDQFCRVVANPINVNPPTNVDPQVLGLAPTQRLQRLAESREPALRFGIIFGEVHQHADPPRPLALLRACRERPHGCRATNNGDEFPPPHGADPKAKDYGLSIAGVGVGQWRASR